MEELEKNMKKTSVNLNRVLTCKSSRSLKDKNFIYLMPFFTITQNFKSIVSKKQFTGYFWIDMAKIKLTKTTMSLSWNVMR